LHAELRPDKLSSEIVLRLVRILGGEQVHGVLVVQLFELPTQHLEILRAKLALDALLTLLQDTDDRLRLLRRVLIVEFREHGNLIGLAGQLEAARRRRAVGFVIPAAGALVGVLLGRVLLLKRRLVFVLGVLAVLALAVFALALALLLLLEGLLLGLLLLQPGRRARPLELLELARDLRGFGAVQARAEPR
jgi:hypothetical protein